MKEIRALKYNLFLIFTDITPSPSVVTSELPEPQNLSDAAFSKFGFLNLDKSSDIFLKQKTELEKKSTTIEQLNKSLSALSINKRTLEVDNADLKAQVKALTTTLEQQNVPQLKADCEVLRQQLARTKREKKALQQRLKTRKPSKMLSNREKHALVKKHLSPYWTDAQISTIMNKNWKRMRKLTPQDYEFALTLRLLSRKTYKFLRDSKCIPLPGFSTLKQYFKDFQISEGLFDNVMHVLKIHANTLSAKERIACLAFDEVHVKSDISWNPSADQIVGPHSEANTMMIRLMFKKLKIPIWYRFDTALDKDELFKIITKVEEVGYNVKTITCDMGPKNRGLATQLGIFVDTENPENSKTWFQNPARPDSKIFWFYDIPHLVKLCRNNVQTYGVELPDGAKIMKDDISGIKHKIDESTTIPSDSKLRKSEIYNVKDLDKQKVCTYM